MDEKDYNVIIDEETERRLQLPPRILSTYARLWQLETWLRRMIYLELHSLLGDEWSKVVKNIDHSLKADKHLTHMSTPEEDPLSYAPFTELQRLVEQYWPQFSPFLPPKDIWKARLKEVNQIRNRVAHFRRGHVDDLQRVMQLQRDVDQGFWRFCTSYNDSHPVLPPTDDPVTKKFLGYDPFPYTEVEDKSWVRVGHADPSMILSLQIQILRRPWAEVQRRANGQAGYLYDVQLFPRDQRTYNSKKFLEATHSVHPHLVHICLDNLVGSVRVTIPAVLGADKLIQIIERLIDVTGYTIRRGQTGNMSDSYVQRLAEEWPEFVLGPENPLTFLGPDNPCAFFGE